MSEYKQYVQTEQIVHIKKKHKITSKYTKNYIQIISYKINCKHYIYKITLNEKLPETQNYKHRIPTAQLYQQALVD